MSKSSVLIHSDFKCYVCGGPIHYPEDDFDIHHAFPKSLGGAKYLDLEFNRVPVHTHCHDAHHREFNRKEPVEVEYRMGKLLRKVRR